ncbi:hypothetical protein [Roseovarius atlanticus]|uniref:hypothetical protein n=1 Tax=Roseovarius atlanticus TaxID=1641875 RepID=UPI001C95C08C|nr:hypothetical protein [Roseovarius atlanticus]MBY5990107.1 hypothetical protein [Roseovarius atlanticus]MBY6126653.1 hypothetical protein [Roseovarius atlanticus]MBY6151147.1 hypothetical protein [Roseovarius atlanticus]
MDWDNPPAIVAQAMGHTHQGPDIAQTWALSPSAWSRFAFLVAAFALAWRATRRPRPATRRMAAEIAVEYRGHATSDARNRDTPQALLATRSALKAHEIEIPVPQQVMRPSGPGAAASPAP